MLSSTCSQNITFFGENKNRMLKEQCANFALASNGKKSNNFIFCAKLEKIEIFAQQCDKTTEQSVHSECLEKTNVNCKLLIYTCALAYYFGGRIPSQALAICHAKPHVSHTLPLSFSPSVQMCVCVKLGAL